VSYSEIIYAIKDAPKASDHVNHYVLVERLIKCGIPVYIPVVRIIIINILLKECMYVCTIFLLVMKCVKEELFLFFLCLNG